MKTAFVIGGAEHYQADYDAAVAAVGEPDGVLVVNDIGVTWPGEVAAWVSLHGAKLMRWVPAREASGLPSAERTVIALSDGDDPKMAAAFTDVVEAKFPGQEHGGSSGLMAAKVALMDLGFDRVILCGVPMTVQGNHFNDGQPWTTATSYWIGWQEALPMMQGKVFSMSGYTAQLLGEPPKAKKRK